MVRRSRAYWRWYRIRHRPICWVRGHDWEYPLMQRVRDGKIGRVCRRCLLAQSVSLDA